MSTCATRAEAEAALAEWYALVEAYTIPELSRLATTIRRWEGEVLAWFDSRLSNGRTEGRNVIIKGVKRISVNRPSSIVMAGRGHERPPRGGWSGSHSRVTIECGGRGGVLRVVRRKSGYRLEGDGDAVVVANRFLDHLRVRAFAASTVRAYAFDVLSFLRFCDERALPLVDVVPTDVFDFLDWLGRPRRSRGVVVPIHARQGAAPATMNRRIAGVRACSSSRCSPVSAMRTRSRSRAVPLDCVRSAVACSVTSRRANRAVAAGWCVKRSGCQRASGWMRSTCSSLIWTRIAIVRWRSRCCSAGYAPERSARCGSQMLTSARAGSASSAKAAGNVSSRSNGASSLR